MASHTPKVAAAPTIATTSPNIDSLYDWQLTKHNLILRGTHILGTGQLADCKFIVGQKLHQQVFKGHKMILAISSPVFEAMFFGAMAEKNDPILVNDVQPEAFKVLLEYIYTDTIDPKTFKLACDLCYCASKYMLPFLGDECVKFILSDLSPEKACYTYELAKLIEKPLLMDKCQEMFRTRTSSILNDPSFVVIQFGTLLTIFEQKELEITSEMELFSAAQRWARSECIRKSLNPNDRDSLRSVLGKALTKIRFLTLTPQQFADSIAGSSLLQENEALAIFMNISSQGKKIPMPGGFSTDSRSRARPQTPVPGQMEKMTQDVQSPSANSRIITKVSSVGATSCISQKDYLRQVKRNNSQSSRSSQPACEHIFLTDLKVLRSTTTFIVDRNISIIGVEVPSQSINSLESRNLTLARNFCEMYDEMFTVTLCNSNRTILASTDYTAQVKKDTLIEVMFNRSIKIEKAEEFAQGPMNSLLFKGNETIDILKNILCKEENLPMPEGFSTNLQSRVEQLKQEPMTRMFSEYRFEIAFGKVGYYPLLPYKHRTSSDPVSFTFGSERRTENDLIASIIYIPAVS